MDIFQWLRVSQINCVEFLENWIGRMDSVVGQHMFEVATVLLTEVCDAQRRLVLASKTQAGKDEVCLVGQIAKNLTENCARCARFMHRPCISIARIACASSDAAAMHKKFFMLDLARADKL